MLTTSEKTTNYVTVFTAEIDLPFRKLSGRKYVAQRFFSVCRYLYSSLNQVIIGEQHSPVVPFFSFCLSEIFPLAPVGRHRPLWNSVL